MSDSIGDPSLAGQVARWHSIPTNRSQSVGEHSWQVARILLAIWPEAPQPLLKEALFHDIGEIGVGDTPYFAKANPAVKAALHKLERTTRLCMAIPWGIPYPQALTPFETHWFDVAHTIADWEFIAQEHMMGNRLMTESLNVANIQVNRFLADTSSPESALQLARATEYCDQRRAAWQKLL